MEIISVRLKELRQLKAVTQKVIAESTGISKRNYIRLEMDDFSPSVDTLIKLADYFNVSLDYLCGRSDVRERR